VNSLAEAMTEYTRKLNELTASGFNQEKFVVILNWLNEQQNYFMMTSSVDPSFPQGNNFI
jgi:hypothetical protein